MLSKSTNMKTWKPVPGWPYLVSIDGFVIRDRPGARPLKVQFNWNNQPYVKLRKPGCRKTFLLGRLVCRLFNGEPPDESCEADHIDRNQANCAAGNLQWLTKAENLARRVKAGQGVFCDAHLPTLALIPLDGEAWRPIPSFPGYFASSFGRVASEIVGGERRLLRQQPQPKGYRSVTLVVDGKRRGAAVGRLVCEAFHGPPPSPDHEADHEDNDPSNNAETNLRWLTGLENVRRARHRRGEAKHNAVLTNAKVLEIRALGPTMSNRALGAKYGVSHKTIEAILHRRKWAHLKEAA